MSSQRRRGAPKEKGYTRRTWTQREEELENYMLKHFPFCDLKADPHIQSKLHVWKKNYSSLASMMTRSGFGWNDARNMVTVEDNCVWEEYVKAMRYKAWPFFPVWRELFGKDRATGEHAEDVVDAANSVRIEEPINLEDLFGPDYDSPPQVNVGVGQKRKASEMVIEEPKLVDVIVQFCHATTASLGTLATRIGFERDASEKRCKVFSELEDIPELLSNERMWAAKQLVKDNSMLDLFFSLPHAKRGEMIRMMITGGI
ncbi:UNVERIFIED_CONTAM: hypothetical protein Slati_1411000 [Sesamum latifolium]|uniref:Myb/SANT-like domain-containing protein n=1 Tax=Sesamum latifolium TaxID=2727402 RepID=A0AAW2X6I8_9LAMI